MHSQEVLKVVWGAATAPNRGPRARFTLTEVAESGVRLADARGLGAVSLAAIAAELGVATTALYRYVDAKETLVDVMVDAAVGAPPNLIGLDWRTGAKTWSTALWRRYTQHPWLTDVRPAGSPRYPNQIAWIEELLAITADAVQQPIRLALLLDAVARSYSQVAPESGDSNLGERWLVEAIHARFPRFAVELEHDWSDIANEFHDAVEVVLTGTPAQEGV